MAPKWLQTGVMQVLKEYIVPRVLEEKIIDEYLGIIYIDGSSLVSLADKISKVTSIALRSAAIAFETCARVESGGSEDRLATANVSERGWTPSLGRNPDRLRVGEIGSFGEDGFRPIHDRERCRLDSGAARPSMA